MKRERLNTAEVEMNNGALDINIWNMLKNRQEAVALINEKYGTDISVELNFTVFDEDSGNASSEEEESAAIDEPMEIAQSDEELQVDGVGEDENNDTNQEESVEESSDTDSQEEQERDD